MKHVVDSRVSGRGMVEFDDFMYPSAIPFVLVHVACIAAFWTGVTYQAIAICLVLYWVRIFAIGAEYNRYFSHRAFCDAANGCRFRCRSGDDDGGAWPPTTARFSGRSFATGKRARIGTRD